MKLTLVVVVVLASAGCAGLQRQVVSASPDCKAMPRDQSVQQYTKEAARLRATEKSWSATESIPTRPSAMHEKMQRLDEAMSQAEAHGCPSLRNVVFRQTGTSFHDEWVYLYEREGSRKHALAAMKERAQTQLDEAAREQAAWREQIEAEAQKRGYKEVVFGVGLTQYLESLVEGGSVKEARGVVIELDDTYDDGLVAIQYLGKGSAIYTSKYTHATVLVRGYAEDIIEGSALTALPSSYVTIKGVQSYQTALGLRQAFIVEIAL